MAKQDRTVSRRRFLAATGVGVVAAPFVASALSRWWTARPQVFVSAQDDPRGGHEIAAFDLERGVRFTIDVDLRCHQPVSDPLDPKRVVVVARRPGTKLYDVDVAAGGLRQVVECPPDRHVYGHAWFSPDGEHLFVSENDFARGQGVIAVHDGRDLRRLGEFPSHGVGPHEIRFLSDERTIVVANGGILTEPQTGREKLNIPTMDPNLAYVDSKSGKLLGAYRLGDHQASIRHLDVAEDDTVAVATQYEGDLECCHPLVAFHRGEDAMRTTRAPDEMIRDGKGYTASVCIDSARRRALATLPRGNRVAVWDVETGDLLAALSVRDAGGVSLDAAGRNYIVTTGFGEIHRIDAEALQSTPGSPAVFEDRCWDNHVMRV